MGLLDGLYSMFYIVPMQMEHINHSNYLVEDENIAILPDYITRAIPFFILFVIFEFFYGKFGLSNRRRYRRNRAVQNEVDSLDGEDELYTAKDTIMSLSLGMIQQILSIFLKEVAYVPYIALYQATKASRREFTNRYLGSSFLSCLPNDNSPLTSGRQLCDESNFQALQIFYFILGFLAIDVSYYFFHRFAHEWHVAWISHSVHHSGERYNFATALRQGALQSTCSWVFYLPWAVVGLPPAHYLRHSRLNVLYQFWIHTEIIGRLPWIFELFFNTPSHHRLHHRPPGNCNYAGVLIIWDRIFGTFVAEADVGQPQPDSIAAPGHLVGEQAEAAAQGFLTNPSPTVEVQIDLPADYRRNVIYGLANPLVSFDPVKANIQHCFNLASAATAKYEGPVTGLDRLFAFLPYLVRRRVNHPLFYVETSIKKLIPDILHDWQVQKAYFSSENYSKESFSKTRLSIIGFYWHRLTRLPPVVPTVAELKAGAYDAVYWTKREVDFLLGRHKRCNSPKLTGEKLSFVWLYLALTLVFTYSLLLFQNARIFQESSIHKLYFIVYSMIAAILLQLMQFNYTS